MALRSDFLVSGAALTLSVSALAGAAAGGLGQAALLIGLCRRDMECHNLNALSAVNQTRFPHPK